MRLKQSERKPFFQKYSNVPPRRPIAILAIAVAAAIIVPLGATAQAVIRDLPVGRFVPYGLDGTLVRVDAVTAHAHVGRDPYLREHRSASGSDGYVLVHLSVRNPGTQLENIPLFAATTFTRGGRAIDPAVYGPFVASSTTAAPSSATIGSRGTIHITLAIADVPDNDPLAKIVLSPNDATPAYRIRLPP